MGNQDRKGTEGQRNQGQQGSPGQQGQGQGNRGQSGKDHEKGGGAQPNREGGSMEDDEQLQREGNLGNERNRNQPDTGRPGGKRETSDR